jgi:hypothetical protein
MSGVWRMCIHTVSQGNNFMSIDGFRICLNILWKIIRKAHECVFWVEISHKWFSWPGNPRMPFSVYHMPLLRVFWGIFSSNRHKFNSEFKTQSSALTWWRYADGSNDMITSRWHHFGPSLGAPTICMTSLRFNDVNHNAAMWYNVWSGKTSHGRIARLTMANVW